MKKALMASFLSLMLATVAFAGGHGSRGSHSSSRHQSRPPVVQRHDGHRSQPQSHPLPQLQLHGGHGIRHYGYHPYIVPQQLMWPKKWYCTQPQSTFHFELRLGR